MVTGPKMAALSHAAAHKGIPVVTTYKYLGVQISPNTPATLKNMKTLITRKVQKYIKDSRAVDIPARKIILESMIRSTVLYQILPFALIDQRFSPLAETIYTRAFGRLMGLSSSLNLHDIKECIGCSKISDIIDKLLSERDES